jgi:hypothetical protein
LLNIDTFTVQMIDTKEQLRSFTKANLKEHGFIPSPMPSFKSTFNAQELADVVSYLVSLKGRALHDSTNWSPRGRCRGCRGRVAAGAGHVRADSARRS